VATNHSRKETDQVNIEQDFYEGLKKGTFCFFAVETYPVGGNGRVGDGSQPEQWTALWGLIRENPVKQTSPGDIRVITDICGV